MKMQSSIGTASRIVEWFVLSLATAAACAADYRINGVAMSIDRVVVHGDARKLREVIAKRWRRVGHGEPLVRRESPGVLLIARRRGAQFQSLALRPARASAAVELTSTISAIGRRPRKPPSIPLLPRAAVHIASTVEELGGIGAITFHGTSPWAVQSLDAAAVGSARRQGWTSVGTADSSARQRVQRVWMQRERTLMLQIWRQAGGSRFALVYLPGAETRAH